MESVVKISVAMCTYNGSRYLENQLLSIMDQSRPVDEIVVIDDASTDSTWSLLSAYQERIGEKLLIYRNEENVGYLRNFQTAIQRCSGHLVLLADQDDIWSREKVASVIRVFECHPNLAMVFSDGRLIDEAGCGLKTNLFRSFGFNARRRKLFRTTPLSVLLGGNIVTGATAAIRRSDALRYLPVPNCYVHDSWFACCAAAENSIGFIEDELISYRIHDGQSIGLRNCRDTSPTFDAELKRLFELKAWCESNSLEKAAATICDKIEFYMFRSNIKKEGFGVRAYQIIKRANQYMKYATGLRSMARDILYGWY